jgi:hypothetical protein
MFRNFWPELRKFHDTIYSQGMNLSDIVKFFERTLHRTSYGLKLSFLEKRIIEILGKKPSSLYKQIAEDLGISEKKVSVTLKNLNTRGIYLGGLISYKTFGLHEFFSFNRSDNFGDNAVLIDRYILFPDLNITHGIMPRKKHGPSFYYVKEKKMYFNSNILTKELSIRDWKKQPLPKQKNFSESGTNTELKKVSHEKQPYLSYLLRNCELDFKRPDIKTISESHDVSARTLFRLKSRLIEDEIIQPNMVVESFNLLQVLIVSKSELVELYNKVPFIRTYQIHDDFGDASWLSYLSIFMPDSKYIYSSLIGQAEIFHVIKRQTSDLNDDSSVFLSGRSGGGGGGLTPYPKDSGDDMTGAAAGMARRYKDK